METKSLLKCVAVPVLAFSTLLSAGLPSAQAANPSIQDSVEKKASKLNIQQLKEYNSLKKQGFNVSVSESEDGTVFINAYDSSPVTNKKAEPGKITTQAVVGEQTFNIKQSVYYGYSRVAGISGKIKVEYRGKTVTPVSDTLRISRGVEKEKKYKSGNPGKVTFPFVINLGSSPFNTGAVPFDSWFYIYSTGKVKFDQTGTPKKF
ncbi:MULTISPECIES: hypothetical protein [Bacillus]|jgi:hypothetical protein|nr:MULTISPECIES: hypothetical protein [Bacillus]MEC1275274.1 hypothetical protein [Bacillus subtilis]MEC1318373.1 hypothetical protein [Bacillus subtilis]UEG59546.1 hypothetical protein LK685_21755 [Bacillus sp. BC1-43]